MLKKISAFILFFIITSYLPAQIWLPYAAKALEFNPNYIISDYTYTNYSCMSVSDIQSFLEQHNSGLARYSDIDADGKEKRAAEIIYRAANEYKINPKFLLVLLQKEQSLIETENPSQYQLDWAAGFARCDDPVLCSPEAVAEYKGFAKQLDRAAWRNRYYIENSHKEWLKQANKTYDFDGYEITPVNQATANLYSYTPHFNGNYNFWKIWNRYFAKNYPDGTLLKSDSTETVYLVDYGMRRPFLNKAALSSRFDPERILTVPEDDILRYELGAPIKFPNFSLIKSPSKTMYLLIDDKKNRIVSPEVFRKIGFIDDEIIELTQQEIDEFANGADITMESVYPLGVLLKDKKTKKLYYVKNGVKELILNMEILKSNFKGKEIIEAEHDDIVKLKNGWPVKFKEGELVKAKGESAVYVISNEERRPINSGQIFEALGYKWAKVIEMEKNTLQLLHSLGEEIDIGIKTESIGEGTLVKSGTSSSVY